MDTRFLEEEKNVFAGKRVFLDNFILPDYDVFNIRNIKSLVGNIYGVNSLKTASFPDGFVDDFGGVQKVFLVVMDGLGYNRLLKHVKQYDGVFSELIAKGVFNPLTNTF